MLTELAFLIATRPTQVAVDNRAEIPAGPTAEQAARRIRPRFELATPLAGLPGVMIDSFLNGYGIAQQTARAQNMQARMMWIDCTANIEQYNTEAKIVDLVAQLKQIGFNSIVLDIKPISGQVIYTSGLAPRLTEWRGRTLPIDFEPVPVFIREARRHGLLIYAGMNAFSEGHRMFLVGPGYAKREQQTVLYDPKPVLRDPADPRVTVDISPRLDVPIPNGVTLYSAVDRVPTTAPDGFALLIRPNGRVADGWEVLGFGPKPTLPARGTIAYATGTAAEFLRRTGSIGSQLALDTEAQYVPISERPEQQIPLMMNPNHPEVQRYAEQMAAEVMTKFDFNGIIYDDRLRYAGLNADFSEITRTAFEQHVGEKLTWPDDVFRYTFNLNLARGIRPGRYYDEWMAWRADRMRQFVAGIRDQIRAINPEAQLGVYAGSWYGEYPNIGSNWASTFTESGFWFATPSYRRSGFANEIDFLITGCYYPTATIYDAMGKGANIGATVEAAAALSNRLVGDATWTYAGLMLSEFRGDPELLADALQAAVTGSQGVMVFDLSHDFDVYAATLRQAFSAPRPAPHQVRGLIESVRRKRAAARAAGRLDPPVTLTVGAAGTGQ